MPPAGVAAIVGFFTGGNGPCDFDPEVLAVHTFSGPAPGTLEMGEVGFLCIAGMAADAQVLARVTGPGGFVLERLIPEVSYNSRDGFGEFHWDWLSLPGEPLGTYRVTATDGQRTAEGEFRVVQPADPRMNVMAGSGGDRTAYLAAAPGGHTFRAVVAGFAPGAVVPVHIYGPSFTSADGVPVGDYVTTLNVEVGSDGGGTSPIPTSSQDEPGDYCIALGEFCAAEFAVLP